MPLRRAHDAPLLHLRAQIVEQRNAVALESIERASSFLPFFGRARSARREVGAILVQQPSVRPSPTRPRAATRPVADCRRPASAASPRRRFRRHRRVVIQRVEQELVSAVRLPAPLRPESQHHDVPVAVIGVERGRFALDPVRRPAGSRSAADCGPSHSWPAPGRGSRVCVSKTGLRSNITAGLAGKPATTG